MAVSALDMFKIGIGPSSSHTVGPMVAALKFVRELDTEGLLPVVTRVRTELFGSLGATGWGHGSESAVLMGLCGETPRLVDVGTVTPRAHAIRDTGRLPLMSVDPDKTREITFDINRDLVLNGSKFLPFHSNAMTMTAWAGHDVCLERTYYSIGGGFVIADDGTGNPPIPVDTTLVRYPFRTADDLLNQCNEQQRTIPSLVLANEESWRPEAQTRAALLEIWSVMHGCIEAGVKATGILPGGLSVRRRSARLRMRLIADAGQRGGELDPLAAMDWVTLWALAVNEENAAGGRVVTAPTNGAAGVIPAVLRYVMTFIPGANDDTAVDFLLTAGAIGAIFKITASISGAEVGCQGEVGTACAMAAAGMAQILGGTPQQVLNAAEIGLEHHLGLTCDPVGGLVQIPCIERNAVAAIKAITAARLAFAGDGYQHVSLDQCIRTMMETGIDMASKYKETARGGLAVNIVEC